MHDFILQEMGTNVSSLDVEATTRQSGFIVVVQFASLSTKHVVQPGTVRLDLLATAVHDGQVQPGSSVTDSRDFVGDVSLGVLAHLSVETFIGVKIVQVLRDGIVIAGGGEVSRLAIDDLEGYTTGTAGDDRLASVKGFRDLDFETFTSGELESNTRVGHQSVQHYRRKRSAAYQIEYMKGLTLIAGWQSHYNNVFDVSLVWLAVELVHDLVVDDAGIGIIDGTVTAKQKLRVLIIRKIG